MPCAPPDCIHEFSLSRIGMSLSIVPFPDYFFCVFLIRPRFPPSPFHTKHQFLYLLLIWPYLCISSKALPPDGMFPNGRFFSPDCSPISFFRVFTSSAKGTFFVVAWPYSRSASLPGYDSSHPSMLRRHPFPQHPSLILSPSKQPALPATRRNLLFTRFFSRCFFSVYGSAPSFVRCEFAV